MKNNKWLNIFVGVISPIFSICGVTLFNIPVEILRVFTFLWLVYIYECFKDLYKLKKKRAKRSKKLKALSKEISELNNTDNSKKKVKEEKEKEYQNRKNYYRKLDEKHEKIKRNIIKVSILFAVFYIPRSDPIISFGQQAINVIIAPFLETEEMDKPFDLTDMESAEEKDSAKNSEDIKSPIEPEDSTEMTGTADSEGHVNRVDFTDSEKNTLVKLDLEFPDGYPGIDNEIKELYNLLFYPGEENVNEIMLSNVTAWIGSCKSNTPLDNAVTDNGESAQYFSGIEAEFSDMIIVLSDLLDIVT